MLVHVAERISVRRDAGNGMPPTPEPRERGREDRMRIVSGLERDGDRVYVDPDFVSIPGDLLERRTQRGRIPVARIVQDVERRAETVPMLPFGELDRRLDQIIDVVAEPDNVRMPLSRGDLAHSDDRLRVLEQILAELSEIVSPKRIVRPHVAADIRAASRIARARSVIANLSPLCQG